MDEPRDTAQKGICDLSKDIIVCLLAWLPDAQSKMSFLSSCKYLRAVASRIHPRLAALERLRELRKWIDLDPPSDDKNAPHPFGNAGSVRALALAPAHWLWEALDMLASDDPTAIEAARLLKNKYLLPVRAFVDCRMYCLFVRSSYGVKLSAGDLRLPCHWEPLPCAVFIALCVLDHYLPRLCDRFDLSLGLVARCYSSKHATLSLALRLAESMVQRQDQPKDKLLDRVSYYALLRNLHPVRNFATLVEAFDHVVCNFRQRFIEPEVYSGVRGAIIDQGGFYRSTVDGRIYSLCWETFVQWVSEDDQITWRTFSNKSLRCQLDHESVQIFRELTIMDESVLVGKSFTPVTESERMYNGKDDFTNLVDSIPSWIESFLAEKNTI